MRANSRITVDLGVLDRNYASWRRFLGDGCGVCPVLKADAYGVGAVAVGRRLAAGGAGLIAVYSPGQAAELVEAGVTSGLLVLMPVEQIDRTDVLYRATVDGRLRLAVHSRAQLGRIEAIGKQFGTAVGVHVEVDTGMSRMGMPLDEADEVLGEIAGRRYVRLAGVFSHAASAATDVAFTRRQFDAFEGLLRRHSDRLGPDVVRHFCGTSAALRDRRYHLDMARIGLGLLGYGLSGVEGGAMVQPAPSVRPVVRWTSTVVHTRSVPARTAVGYQGSYVTDRPTRLGVVPVGHADGYPMALGNRGVVRVGEELREAPVRGQVNMDQIIVELTDVADAGNGSPVELIADDPRAANALPNLAALADSNCYELLCRLSPRVQRRYVTSDRATGRVGHVATV